MPQLFVLMNVAVIATTIGVAFREGDKRSRLEQIERPLVSRAGDTVLGNQNAVSLTRSPSLFFLHLLKHKKSFPTLEKISTTTPATMRDCICVPFYLCNANQTIITDGAGVIDVRIRRCSGDFEVCCYLPNVTGSLPPIVTPIPTRSSPRPFPTAPPTIPPTVPPIILPTIILTSSSPLTGQPGLNCICVEISQCDPNGIVTISGEGIISPRQQFGLCPGSNQVCCRILATTTTQPSTTSTPTTMTSPPTTMTPAPLIAPGEICFVCGDTVQCITCGTIVGSSNGTIEPRLPLSRGRSVCTMTEPLVCQGATMVMPASTMATTSSLEELLGPPKNSGTPQICYCVKTWLCSEGSAISPDGLNIIDSRFTLCASADQVCCRSTGIDLQSLRSVDAPAFSAEEQPDLSSNQVTCGLRNSSYAPPQLFPVDSERTYFAEFPWMVALLVRSARGAYVFQCGASIVSNRAILTAAHCVANQSLENLVARFGQWDVGNDTQPLPVQEASILAMAVHPSYYSGGLFHDVATLILDEPIVYGANVLPICLPEQGMVFAAGTRCYGTGWGSKSFEGSYQAQLRKVELPIVDRANCQTRLRNTKLGQYFQLHGSFICAGGEKNRDTCRGDGGGPLTCQAATGQYFQAGIVSWGIGCGASNVPAVYASVSQHRQWIDRQLATYGAR